MSTNYARRDQISDAYKWDLTSIYRTTTDFEKTYTATLSKLSSIETLKGTLGKDVENVLICLELSNEIMKIVTDLYVYAKMIRDENMILSSSQELSDKADIIYLKASTAVSFIVPELTSLDDHIMDEYISSERLIVYRHFLSNIKRQKKYILSEAEERVISMTGEILSSPGEIFTMFDNADISFEKIKDEKGNMVPLTKGNYITFLQSKKRSLRKAAYKEMYKRYRAVENTLAKVLAVNTKVGKLSVDLRGYSSCLAAALDSDNIVPAVYTNLISIIDSNQPLIDKYLRIRKRILGVKKLRLYDVYVPIIDVPEKKYTYEESVDIVINALEPLGRTYIDDLKKAFKERWIDVFESTGKKSGAYSWGTYNSHPFVLLNFQGTIKDIFTIAHEMGHAMHSYYSNKNQEFVNSSYPIFLAEVASTTNELLLADHLIRNTSDDTEKASLLNHYLEEFRTTVFRQTMFAEFELTIHNAVEKGEALTTEYIKETYTSLVNKHFGNVVEIDKDIASEWSRIPHFYSSFYVYKYATGFCAAVALSRKILSKSDGARSAYLKFLASGGSDYPLNLLIKAGVDLSSTAPIESAMKVFDNILKEMERII